MRLSVNYRDVRPPLPHLPRQADRIITAALDISRQQRLAISPAIWRLNLRAFDKAGNKSASLEILQFAQVGSACLHRHDALKQRDAVVAQRDIFAVNEHIVKESGHSRDH